MDSIHGVTVYIQIRLTATVVRPLLDLAIYSSNHSDLAAFSFLKCKLKIKLNNMHVNFDPSFIAFLATQPD